MIYRRGSRPALSIYAHGAWPQLDRTMDGLKETDMTTSRLELIRSELYSKTSGSNFSLGLP